MDGIHDLGGREGFGSVLGGGASPTYDQETKFSSPWQRKAFGLVEILIGSGTFNVDRFRHAVERVDPITYLAAGYYGRWFAAVEILLHDAGVLPAPETLADGAPDPERLAEVEQIVERLIAGRKRSGSAQRQVPEPPRFAVGDPVRCRDLHRHGHCRLPAYARGREGVVVEVHPAFVYPDTNALDAGEFPQHLYSVQFRSEDLWGDACEPGTRVSVDLFEPYLEGGGDDPADRLSPTPSKEPGV